MIVGFTGTKNGMTHSQRCSVLKLLKYLEPEEAHHGDCISKWKD